MGANPKPESPSRTGQRNPKAETPDPLAQVPGGADAIRFLTREELAEALKISVRTVDTMVAGGEIPHLRVHGNFIRFYLPDVVRHLTATALVSKRRWAGPCRKRTPGDKGVPLPEIPNSKLQAPGKLQVARLQRTQRTERTQGT